MRPGGREKSRIMTIFFIAILLALVPLGVIWPRVDAVLLILAVLLALAYASNTDPSEGAFAEARARPGQSALTQ